MKLLFITQKIHANDDDLAFTILWIKELIRQGVDVQVICLEKGDFDSSFPVYSLGKEEGVGRMGRILRFWKYIRVLNYDAVFVHMNPEYITLGGLYWYLTGRPTYLWYTHYTMHIHLWIAGKLATKLFAATPQSLPQYDHSPKKRVLGHGIDTAFWQGITENNRQSETKLLSVHRLSRSKRIERAINALALLPKTYTLDVYGRAIDPTYFEELTRLVEEKDLSSRVCFHGPIPMHELRDVYRENRLVVNMAPDTIDKTMLECMQYGIYPVTTPATAVAIGLPIQPVGEEPQDITAFIKKEEWKAYNTKELRRIIEERHSLTSLIRKMIVEMKL